jgi:hypothetical protein
VNPPGTASLRSAAGITIAALAALAAYAALPRGGQLTHMDFLADNATVLELCNPLSYGPLPTAAGRSPATMRMVAASAANAGGRVSGAFDLVTISGKPVAPEDLMTIGGEKIRLGVAGGRGQVAHFDPDKVGVKMLQPDPLIPGRWLFSVVAMGPGPWILSAEFTPVATGKPLQVSAKLETGN